mmetsp:Transcript_29929/g.63048  ORF Transcript_29929/g.63048 Transcript_29929/m.63048 type:complete len:237 (-) Transcript_29929:574-1284(-)
MRSVGSKKSRVRPAIGVRDGAGASALLLPRPRRREDGERSQELVGDERVRGRLHRHLDKVVSERGGYRVLLRGGHLPPRPRELDVARAADLEAEPLRHGDRRHPAISVGFRDARGYFPERHFAGGFGRVLELRRWHHGGDGYWTRHDEVVGEGGGAVGLGHVEDHASAVPGEVVDALRREMGRYHVDGLFIRHCFLLLLLLLLLLIRGCSIFGALCYWGWAYHYMTYMPTPTSVVH